MITAWNGLTPIGVFPIGASGCSGVRERADLIGPKRKVFLPVPWGGKLFYKDLISKIF